MHLERPLGWLFTRIALLVMPACALDATEDVGGSQGDSREGRYEGEPGPPVTAPPYVNRCVEGEVRRVGSADLRLPVYCSDFWLDRGDPAPRWAPDLPTPETAALEAGWSSKVR